MSHRRKSAIASSVIVLASVLSSCGFNEATDMDYPVGTGAEDRTQVVDVLSAHVVSDVAGRGVVIATLNNGSADEEIALTGVTSDEADVSTFDEITIGKRKSVQLGGPDAAVPSIQVTDQGQTFEGLAPEKPAKGEETELVASGYDADLRIVGGKYVRVTMQFSNGEAVKINVPVMRNCGYFANTPGINAGPERCPSGGDLKQELHH